MCCLDYLRTRFTLLGKEIEELVDLPEMKDPYKLATIRILSIAGPAIYLSLPDMMPLLVFKTIELSVKYGNTPETAL